MKPSVGAPAHYIHVIWLAARAGDPQEYYDELDADRWSIRFVRLYRGGDYKACSYDSPDWRDEMPEAPIDLPDVINRDSQFLARAITREEFEAIWATAQPENPLSFNLFDEAGRSLCPCCGTPDQFSYAPYDGRGGIIGSGVCGCCLWEPGFDDDRGASSNALPTIKASLVSYRTAWIAEGYPWKSQRSAALQPDVDWDGSMQCKALLRNFPFLE